MSIIFNNDVSKVKKGGRKAKRITMDVFKKELLTFIQKYNPYDKIDTAAFMASADPINDNTDKIAKAGKDAINGFVEGDEARMMMMGLRRFTKIDGFNAKEARQQIAQRLIEAGKYNF